MKPTNIYLRQIIERVTSLGRCTSLYNRVSPNTRFYVSIKENYNVLIINLFLYDISYYLGLRGNY